MATGAFDTGPFHRDREWRRVRDPDAGAHAATQGLRHRQIASAPPAHWTPPPQTARGRARNRSPGRRGRDQVRHEVGMRGGGRVIRRRTAQQAQSEDLHVQTAVLRVSRRDLLQVTQLTTLWTADRIVHRCAPRWGVSSASWICSSVIPRVSGA
jgi:hypothetical protein